MIATGYQEYLRLAGRMISSVIDDLVPALPFWERMIGISFLPDEMKSEYRLLLKARRGRLLG